MPSNQFFLILLPRYENYSNHVTVVPNQYSHQIIDETQKVPVAGQASLFGKLRTKLQGKSQNFETAEPYLNPVNRTEDL